MSAVEELELLAMRAEETLDLAKRVRQLEALVRYYQREAERPRVGLVARVELVAVDLMAGRCVYRAR